MPNDLAGRHAEHTYACAGATRSLSAATAAHLSWSCPETVLTTATCPGGSHLSAKRSTR